MDTPSPRLKRNISLPLVIFYGLGTILGAGVYVLVGKVAALSGIYTPFAFLLSALIALFTAFSYAELSARYPKSAGEAVYVHNAFNRNGLATLVGWLVVLTGIVSAATLLNGVVGYVQTLLPIPGPLIIIILVLCLGTLAIWGIRESAITATIITCIEIAGLLFVLLATKGKLSTHLSHVKNILPPFSIHAWSSIFSGAFLAFYAFIGFEDMVNIAEEVIHPEKTLPKAILWALGSATFLYVLIAIAAIVSLPLSELTQSKAPLADIVRQAGYSPKILGVIGAIAVINGALIQMIMASRVIYGLGKQNGAPKLLAYVNQTTQTPIIATTFTALIMLTLALWFPLMTLAQLTSYIILCVFAFVNLSLIVIKARKKQQVSSATYPITLPIIGFITCLLLIGLQIATL